IGNHESEKTMLACSANGGNAHAPAVGVGPADGPLPTDDARFVGIFRQVCQTMAFVHSRGVIHRDLKPSTIMVGAFGEVQVMGWGLAKVLKDEGRRMKEESDRGPSDSSCILHASSLTQAGTVLGTPAYMAPEQARGQVRDLDERCDVFSLGAILCE